MSSKPTIVVFKGSSGGVLMIVIEMIGYAKTRRGQRYFEVFDRNRQLIGRVPSEEWLAFVDSYYTTIERKHKDA